MRQTLLPLLALLLSTACVDASSPPPNPPPTGCPASERPHPITGICQASNPDNNGTHNTQTTAALDMRRAQDTGPDHGSADMRQADQRPDLRPDDMPAPVDMDRAEMDPPATTTVRFVALGDQGTGSDTQRKVGQAIGTVCQDHGGCDFGMLLGDNAYQSGVDGVDDPMFERVFATPYGHLDFPFYVVLGNHDLGGDGLGIDLDFEKGDYQVQYSQKNPQWIMPAKHYVVDVGPMRLIGLNSTDIFFGNDDDQRQDVAGWIQQAPLDSWVIAFGHHPYVSNGKHGNAGSYEGLPFVPIANGEHVKSFSEAILCGQVDLYLAGHDHSMQDLGSKCGTEFIVSGAGAKTTELGGNNNVHFESLKKGFALLEVTTTHIDLFFFDEDATQLHQRRITR